MGACGTLCSCFQTGGIVCSCEVVNVSQAGSRGLAEGKASGMSWAGEQVCAQGSQNRTGENEPAATAGVGGHMHGTVGGPAAARPARSARHGQPLARALGPRLVLFIAASKVIIILFLTGGRLAPLLAPAPAAPPAARCAAPAGAASAAAAAAPRAPASAAPRAAGRRFAEVLHPAGRGRGRTRGAGVCAVWNVGRGVWRTEAFTPSPASPSATPRPHQLGVRSSPSPSSSPPGDSASPPSSPAPSALPGASPSPPARRRTRWP